MWYCFGIIGCPKCYATTVAEAWANHEKASWGWSNPPPPNWEAAWVVKHPTYHNNPRKTNLEIGAPGEKKTAKGPTPTAGCRIQGRGTQHGRSKM